MYFLDYVIHKYNLDGVIWNSKIYKFIQKYSYFRPFDHHIEVREEIMRIISDCLQKVPFTRLASEILDSFSDRLLLLAVK